MGDLFLLLAAVVLAIALALLASRFVQRRTVVQTQMPALALTTEQVLEQASQLHVVMIPRHMMSQLYGFVLWTFVNAYPTSYTEGDKRAQVFARALRHLVEDHADSYTRYLAQEYSSTPMADLNYKLLQVCVLFSDQLAHAHNQQLHSALQGHGKSMIDPSLVVYLCEQYEGLQGAADQAVLTDDDWKEIAKVLLIAFGLTTQEAVLSDADATPEVGTVQASMGRICALTASDDPAVISRQPMFRHLVLQHKRALHVLTGSNALARHRGSSVTDSFYKLVTR